MGPTWVQHRLVGGTAAALRVTARLHRAQHSSPFLLLFSLPFRILPDFCTAISHPGSTVHWPPIAWSPQLRAPCKGSWVNLLGTYPPPFLITSLHPSFFSPRPRPPPPAPYTQSCLPSISQVSTQTPWHFLAAFHIPGSKLMFLNCGSCRARNHLPASPFGRGVQAASSLCLSPLLPLGGRGALVTVTTTASSRPGTQHTPAYTPLTVLWLLGLPRRVCPVL